MFACIYVCMCVCVCVCVYVCMCVCVYASMRMHSHTHIVPQHITLLLSLAIALGCMGILGTMFVVYLMKKVHEV
jgi:hypothetical protein